MDQTNAALVRLLRSRDVALDLVGYRADPEFTNDNALRCHLVPKPGGSYFLGQYRLDARGRKIAAAAIRQDYRTRVLVNATNCRWYDLNWVHFVHHAWSPRVANAPAWLRGKTRLERALTLRRERQILAQARLLIANSSGTRRELQKLGIPSDRIVVVYPGCDVSNGKTRGQLKSTARHSFGIDNSDMTVSFVGALSHDRRKGFDTLWEAWQRLAASGNWQVNLLVAGEGRALEFWRQRVRAAGLERRVKLVGFSRRIDELLAASDLLVSPVRYEPYGLNVHEAIACGVPALVSACAGIAERYPANLRGMLIKDPDDPEELAVLLATARERIENLKHCFKSFANYLSTATGEKMALEILDAIEGAPAENATRTEPVAVEMRS
jgi:glycosyltransferase involved in cell wall biosynthesis